jgi:hypothetical protein
MPDASDPQNSTRAALHARAGQSQDELRKLLTSMSIGGLGVFFVILTNERSAQLSSYQRCALLAAIVLMASSIFSGVVAWKCAGWDFYAKAQPGHGPSYKGWAHYTKTTFDYGLLLFFFLGVLASAAYLFVHVYNSPLPSVKTSNPTVKQNAMLKGMIAGRATNDYVLRAKAGQTMNVRMSSNNTFLYFNVLDGATQKALFVGEHEPEPHSWTGTLPSDGDYIVRIYLVRAEALRGGKAPYTFTVTIHASPNDSAGAG